VRPLLLRDLRRSLLDVESRRVSIDGMADLKNAIGERYDALSLDQQRELVRGHLDIRLHPGRGPERVLIHHLEAASLNDDEDGSHDAR